MSKHAWTNVQCVIEEKWCISSVEGFKYA